MKRLTKIGLYLSLVLFIIIHAHPVWARILSADVNGILRFGELLIIPALIIMVFVDLVKLFRQNNYRKWSSYLLIMIVPILLASFFYRPFYPHLDKMYGEVVYRACYEGTMNQATLKLRDNGNFDIHWTGAFFYDEYFRGTYQQQNDTIIFDFKDDLIPREMTNKALKVDGVGLSVIEENGEIFPYDSYFYEGKCLGLN